MYYFFLPFLIPMATQLVQAHHKRFLFCIQNVSPWVNNQILYTTAWEQSCVPLVGIGGGNPEEGGLTDFLQKLIKTSWVLSAGMGKRLSVYHPAHAEGRLSYHPGG